MDVDMDEKQIFANLDSKNRNMVRKAQKNDVIIEQREIEEIDDFIDMYNETMIKNQAAKYYIFEKEYFDSLNEMKDNVCLFMLCEGMYLLVVLLFIIIRSLHIIIYLEVKRNLENILRVIFCYIKWHVGHIKRDKKFHLGGVWHQMILFWI